MVHCVVESHDLRQLLTSELIEKASYSLPEKSPLLKELVKGWAAWVLFKNSRDTVRLPTTFWFNVASYLQDVAKREEPRKYMRVSAYPMGFATYKPEIVWLQDLCEFHDHKDAEGDEVCSLKRQVRESVRSNDRPHFETWVKALHN